MEASKIYLIITNTLLLIYYVQLWLRASKALDRGKGLAILNLFADGIPGAGQLVGFIFVHILYVLTWIIWYTNFV